MFQLYLSVIQNVRMKVIFIVSIIFWEHPVITNGNVQEKDAKMIDIFNGCFGVNCTEFNADIRREITKENQIQTTLSEQHPLISTGQSEKPKINFVTRSGLEQELETVDHLKNPTEPIKARHKRGVSHKKHVSLKKHVSHKKPGLHKKHVPHKRPGLHKKHVPHKRPGLHKKHVSHKRPGLHKKRVSHKRRFADNANNIKTARIVAIEAKTMTVESTQLMKENLNGSVEHLNSLFGDACKSITVESNQILEKLKSFARETEQNIKDNINVRNQLEAQSIAATNLAEVYKLSFINTAKLPSIYFPKVDGVINLIEGNAVKVLKTSIAFSNKMVKLQTTNEHLRNFIDTQIKNVSNVARKCALDFTVIAQSGIDKLKIHSVTIDGLFTQLADTYGQKFTAMSEENYCQEIQFGKASSKLIKQIEESNENSYDNIFASSSGPINLLIREFENDIKEIVENKFKLA